MRNDLAVVQIHAGTKVELLPLHIEFGDIGHPLLGGSRRVEVALQDIGYVHVVKTVATPVAPLYANQRAQSHLLHKPQNALVVDGLDR